MSEAPIVLAEVPGVPPARSRARAPRRRLYAGGLAVGLGFLAVVIGASAVGHIFGLLHPDAVNFDGTLKPPSLSHVFGTDDLGRDVFDRSLAATLLDLQVGLVSTAIPLGVGVFIGAIVGYAGGIIDTVVMRVMDVILALPFLVCVMALVAIYGSGLTGIYVGLSVTAIPVFVRITRGEMLVLRERHFILAAQTLGLSRGRILGRHALPHLVRPNLVYGLSNVVGNITALAALSYLGLGAQPPTPEWGAIIAEGQSYLLTAWWISTLPGLFMVAVGVAIYVTGEGLGDMLSDRLAGAV